MIPLPIAGPVVSWTPQDVPTGTDVFLGGGGFLVLFERGIEMGAVTQAIDMTAPGVLIDMSGAPTGRESLAAPRVSPDGGGEKDHAERAIDPVMVMLLATFGLPPQRTPLEPFPGL